jgi:diguanylate cyclase (GGDEF)-like protein
MTFRIDTNWRLLESTHAEAQAICQVLFVKEKKHILQIDDKEQARLFLPDSERDGFRKRLRKYLKPLSVDKVRIWDLSHQVINDGNDDKDARSVARSGALEEALAGRSFSRMEENAVNAALAELSRGVRKQVVSYLPIWGRNKEVLGAIEIRRNLDNFRTEMRRGMIFFTLLLGTVLFVLFGCVYALVKRGAERLLQAQKDLHVLATTDSLTGVYNRREILIRAEERFSQWQGGDGPNDFDQLGILMLDVDDFKSINDVYGHPVGDQVLRELASRIQSVLRPDDAVGRFGGEEFLAILADTRSRKIADIAERLCEAVRDNPFHIGELEVYGSVSIGGTVAHFLDKRFEEVLHRADEGLYRSKNLGKNRVSWLWRAYPESPCPITV